MQKGGWGMPLASGGDEGRGKRRNAEGTRWQGLILRCPNGATHWFEEPVLLYGGRTRRTETSKYPQEEKTIVIPSVVASERGTAQTIYVTA